MSGPGTTSWSTSGLPPRRLTRPTRTRPLPLPLLVHVAEPIAGDVHAHAVDGRRRRDVQRLPVVVAPVEVAGAFGDVDGPEMLALRAKDPNAPGPGDVDVAALVRLHAVDEPALRDVAVADVLRKHASVRERVVRPDVEDTDVRPLGVVDIEQ